MSSDNLREFGTYVMNTLRDGAILAFRDRQPAPSPETVAAFTQALDIGIGHFLNQLDNAAHTQGGLEIRQGKRKLTDGDFAFGAALDGWMKNITHFDKNGNLKEKPPKVADPN